MKTTKFILANRFAIENLLNGQECNVSEMMNASVIINQRYVKKVFSKIPKLAKYLIDNKYFCIVYFAPKSYKIDVTTFGCEKPVYRKGLDKSRMQVKICTVYDKDLNFVKKGTLNNMAKFLGIINDSDYEDVSNIETKPELLLKILKAYMPNTLPRTLQEIADEVLQDCKDGKEYAQILAKPKSPIIEVCDEHGITRSELAKSIGVTVQTIEQCLSRGKCSKNVLKRLKEVYKYV